MSTRRVLALGATGTGVLAAVAALAIGFWIPVKAELAQILLERAWHAARSGDDDARPWRSADTVPIARLAIPSVDVTWIVLAGASGRNLAFSPTLMDGSAAPGEAGVTLIAAHRDTHFRRLGELEAGARILVEDTTGRIHTYEVFRTDIVDATKTRVRLDAESPMLVLSTCYPFDALAAGGPLRFLVQARALPQTT